MPYNKQTWANDAAGGTPLSAARLNYMEDGIDAIDADVVAHAGAVDPHAGYVLESLVDAAGDLLVGTGPDAVGRLAKGAALDVLRVNAGGTALEYAPAGVQRNTVTTAAYTAALADANKVIRTTFAGPSTLTIPANATVAFPLDTIINAYAAGGALTIAAAAGVTIRNNAAALAQYGEASLRKDGTDEWVRVG